MPPADPATSSPTSPIPPRASFEAPFREDFQRLLTARRDVRHFRRENVDPGILRKLLTSAMLAPSVGYSQPWRWVLVEDPARRAQMEMLHQKAKAGAGGIYEGERASLYGSLKLSGMPEAPVHLAVFVDTATEGGHGLGRQTMPETLVWSVVMAIHTLWLSVTAEGLGMGWVSILDPAETKAILDVPPHWQLAAYLCLGWPERYEQRPLLESCQWETRQDFHSVVWRR